jgi:hypothetical protein
MFGALVAAFASEWARDLFFKGEVGWPALPWAPGLRRTSAPATQAPLHKSSVDPVLEALGLAFQMFNRREKCEGRHGSGRLHSNRAVFSTFFHKILVAFCRASRIID